MDEPPGRDTDAGTEATDEDVAASVSGSEGEREGSGAGGATPDVDLPEEVLNAPASAEDGDHTLLEEHEREQESDWKARLRTGAFWLGATAASVAVTLTAIVSLTASGLSDGLSFILASVGMAVIVGLVFLSVRA